MLNTIRPYITKDEPFGPIDSLDIDSHDVKAIKLLFEQHNWIYKNLRNRPSIKAMTFTPRSARRGY
jgi:hypothetical protein